MALRPDAAADLPPPSLEDTVLYPCGDDEPLDLFHHQLHAMIHAGDAISQHCRATSVACLVRMEGYMYYREGDPKARVVPDVLMTRNAVLHHRESYRIWDVGRPPDLIVEIASEGTFRRDEVDKLRLYQSLGVTEYWQYDPDCEWLRDGPLVGWRLSGGRYEAVAAEYWPEAGADVYYSRELETWWGELPEGDIRLRLWSPKLGDWYPTSDENHVNVLREAARADNAETRTASAEARAASAETRAESAETRTASAEARAASAEARAESAEAEIARLRALLGGRG